MDKVSFLPKPAVMGNLKPSPHIFREYVWRP